MCAAWASLHVSERPTGRIFDRKHLRRSCNRTAKNMKCVRERILAPMQPASASMEVSNVGGNRCRRRRQHHLCLPRRLLVRPRVPAKRICSPAVAARRVPQPHWSRGMPRIPMQLCGARNAGPVPDSLADQPRVRRPGSLWRRSRRRSRRSRPRRRTRLWHMPPHRRPRAYVPALHQCLLRNDVGADPAHELLIYYGVRILKLMRRAPRAPNPALAGVP